MKPVMTIRILLLLSAVVFRLEAKDLEVTVHPDQSYQTLQGFGCSINGWTAPLYSLYYNPEFANYAANELGQSIFRLQIWGGVTPRPIEDWRDIDYRKFQWKGPGMRGKVNVDWARALVDANPEVKIIGTVWSPPGWMKVSGEGQGKAAGYLLAEEDGVDRENRLRDDHYKHFAKWVVEWARYMESQGTPFYAISLQNELLFNQPYDSAVYSAEQYARVVQVTGEMFASEGVRKPLFFGPEDMTMATYRDEVRHKPYVDALMAPDVAPYFDVFATHGYTDGVNADSGHSTIDYWDAIKGFGRPYWITEGGTGEHDWPEPIFKGIASRLHVALTESNVTLFCGWVLTEEAQSSHNFMEWERPTLKTYAAMHFWRHLRPGTVRVGADLPGESEGVVVSAYRDDGRGKSIVIIINRNGGERTVAIDWEGATALGGWEVWQTSANQLHSKVQLLGYCENRARLLAPGYSITTLVVDSPPSSQN